MRLGVAFRPDPVKFIGSVQKHLARVECVDLVSRRYANAAVDNVHQLVNRVHYPGELVVPSEEAVKGCVEGENIGTARKHGILHASVILLTQINIRFQRFFIQSSISIWFWLLYNISYHTLSFFAIVFLFFLNYIFI